MSSPSPQPADAVAVSDADPVAYMQDLGRRARAASRTIAVASTEQKSRALQAIANALNDQRVALKAANPLRLRFKKQWVMPGL